MNLMDALIRNPGIEDNKYASSSGHLSKMLSSKRYNVLYTRGGLLGLEKGFKTDKSAGLSVDERTVGESVAYEEVVTINAPNSALLVMDCLIARLDP
jgi:Ca2+-transporting ATPase